ncbi:MAG: MerR family transcriptional regulator [Verrucomicrobiales bacterium]|nr:MerR family transcriptional regulator [Verrucomicrobiales bacterium]
MPSTRLRHSIKVVSHRTGLSPHVIRVWERRYGTVQPERSEGNQRFYSEEDVQRLALLKQATDAGHPISNITHLSVPHLRALLSPQGTSGDAPLPRVQLPAASPTRNAEQLIEAALKAVVGMDSAALEKILEEGAVTLGQNALLLQVIAPLVQRIGEEWQKGTLRIVHEHQASAVIRTFLGRAARPLAMHASAPVLVAATPAGQLHEIGAALVAAAASNQGWRVVYLGPSLPAEEIASAARQNGARVVALSIVHPADDPNLPDELRRLRQLLPDSVTVVAGGRSAEGYRDALFETRANLCGSLADFSSALDLLRQGVN